MTNQMSLDFTPTREHDLPPKWDGHHVTWDETWEEYVEPFICPPPKDLRTCEHCGSARKRLKKGGSYQSGTKTWRTKYNERKTSLDIRHLIAYRCTDCGVDEVTSRDKSGMQVWVLDPEDYTHTGSYAAGYTPLKAVPND